MVKMQNFFFITLVKGFVIECVLFPFETSDQCTFFSENFAVNLYSVRVVARFRVNSCYYNC